jgi:prevent-host-death family protein
MEEIPVSKFKATCLAVIERVRRTRRPVRITKFGEPVAQLIPAVQEGAPERVLGAMKGTAVIVGDIISPASDEEDWEALR